MKKTISLFISLIYTTYSCCMEKSFNKPATKAMYTVGQGHHIILLIRKNIYKLDGKVGVIAVGIHQQQSLEKIVFDDVYGNFIGQTFRSAHNIVKIKITESDSEDESHAYFYSKPDYQRKIWDLMQYKTLVSRIILVAEPRLSENHTDDEFAQAKKDLAACYKNILINAQILFTEPGPNRQIYLDTRKTIALPDLATKTGIDRATAAEIAVTTVAKFVRKNPTLYAVILFAIIKKPDFKRYKKHLDKLYNTPEHP